LEGGGSVPHAAQVRALNFRTLTLNLGDRWPVSRLLLKAARAVWTHSVHSVEAAQASVAAWGLGGMRPQGGFRTALCRHMAP
jgi:hypothetical protein